MTALPKIVTDDPVEVTQENQKFFIFNMVSPLDKDQKCDVYAFRMLAVCKTEQEAKTMAMAYGQRDPRWRVYRGDFGRFLPWVFDPTVVKDAEEQHQEMRELLDQQEKQQLEAEAHFYDRVMAEKMAAHQARFARKVAEQDNKGDEVTEAEERKGNAISARYNILQLENVCMHRNKELQFWKDRFAADFNEEEQAHAKAYDYPLPADVAPMFTV